MALSKKRRELRIMSIETAAQLIGSHLEFGATAEKLNLEEEERDILEIENKRTQKILEKLAEKLKKAK